MAQTRIYLDDVRVASLSSEVEGHSPRLALCRRASPPRHCMSDKKKEGIRECKLLPFVGWPGGHCFFSLEATASLLGWAALGLQCIALWVEAFT
jgi:hypothetical protein